MKTFQANTRMAWHPEDNRIKRFGWCGMVFFFVKGLVWLLAPLIFYAIQ